MLIALLFQAAVAAAPTPQAIPSERPRSPGVVRSSDCNARVIEAMAPAMGEAALRDFARRLQAPRPARGLSWVPEDYPEAGIYAAVERQVDGCPVPTPIYLPNAGSRPATPE